MKKIKLLLILAITFIVCGCGNSKGDNVIKSFEKKVNSVKSYSVTGLMEITSNEETYSYDVFVDYKYDDYYKVTLVNKINDHEQIILKNDDGVYVVTPALNKSFKFQSEWPLNSSQSYLLKSLVNDIKKTEEPKVETTEDHFIVTADVDYPNNPALVSEKLYFDKKNDLKEVHVLNDAGNTIIKMKFNNIKYSVKFDDNNFSLDSLISNSCDEEGACKEITTSTSISENVVYPLYVPADTHLSTKDTIETDTGDRIVMTYAGSKPFMLIEEMVTASKEMEVTSIYGDPLILSNAIGALSSNSLEWQSNNVQYYITSSYLTSEEMLTIAESLSTAEVIEVMNSK